MSAPDPGKIQKFREMLQTGDRRPRAAFNISMEERLLFTDWGTQESPRRPRAHFPGPLYARISKPPMIARFLRKCVSCMAAIISLDAQ